MSDRVIITCDCGTEFYVPDVLMPKQGEVGRVTCPDCLASYDFHFNGGLVAYSYHDFDSEEDE